MPSCAHVQISKISSIVPRPPGRAMKASARSAIIALRSCIVSKPRLERMRQTLSGYVERGELAGLVALVARDGDVHVDALGTMALGSAAPMTRDAIFRIASIAKPVTAAAAIILVEDCKLRLDESADA